ncbi:hypothetical protein [Streptomyces sp. SAI-229]|jgi:hypothetical protein|uniref:hypothetical protein n=1 Tax=Streptomyces sp. SAI-229 TaxID=3377731 RepID=UPI003C7CAD52
MSTRADHGHELVPRPEQTPDAPRAALAARHARARSNLEHEDAATARKGPCGS